MENSAYKYLFMILGSTQFFIAAVELIAPLRSFKMWSIWVSFRLFPLHGAVLIAVGLPLVAYKGFLSSVIFWIGVFIALMGPVIMIYPEMMRQVFAGPENGFSDRERRVMVYMDGIFRLFLGTVFLVSCWKTFYN